MAEILLMEAERKVHLSPNGWTDTSPTTKEYLGKVTVNRATTDEEASLSILTEKYSVVCDRHTDKIWNAILGLQNKVLFVSGVKINDNEPKKVLIALGAQLSRQHFKHDEGRHLFEKVVDVPYLLNIQKMFEEKGMRLDGETEKAMLTEQRYLVQVMIQDVSDKKDENMYKLTLCDPEDTRCRVEASIVHDKAEKLLGHSTEELEEMTDRGHRQACDAPIDDLITLRLKAKVFPPCGSQKLYFDVDAIL